MPVRSPHLHDALRAFCLSAFAHLGAETAEEIPFVVEERAGLYEYRPLVGDQVEACASSLSALEDARIAIDELRRDRAAAIFAPDLFRTILLPLLVRTAEACGSFDWEDGAFE